MKVFSKEKYISDRGVEAYKDNKALVDYCDGKRVKIVWCGPFKVREEWCDDIPDQKPEPAPHKYRIVIESDGKTTTAIMEANGKKVKETVARLHPYDKFNWRTGSEIAFGRLWEKKDKDGQSAPSKPSVKEIKNALKAAKDICTGSHCVDCQLSVGGGWCFCDSYDPMFPGNWRTRWEGDANEQGRKAED